MYQKNINMLYESREEIFNLFDNYSAIVSQANQVSFQGEGLKILTPKQIFQKLPIVLP